MANFSDLPIEIKVKIFENVNMHQLVEYCSRTCLQWRAIIAQLILRPKIQRLRWTGKINDTEGIISGYHLYFSKFTLPILFLIAMCEKYSEECYTIFNIRLSCYSCSGFCYKKLNAKINENNELFT